MEAAALVLAGLAAVTYAGRTGLSARLLLPGIVTLLAFGAWAIVQLDPSITDAALVNDVAIVLFILDLALILGRGESFPAVVGAHEWGSGSSPARIAAFERPPPGHPLARADRFVRLTHQQSIVAALVVCVAAVTWIGSRSAGVWLVASVVALAGLVVVHISARRARRRQMLVLIAEGHRTPAIPIVEAEALLLGAPAHRQALARRFADRLRDAERWYLITPSMRPLASARALASYAVLVHQIADTLNRDATPPARGVALLELLLADGTSPLYAGGEELGLRLQEIAAHLGLDNGEAP